MNILDLAKQTLRVEAKPEVRRKTSKLQDMLDSNKPNGFDQKLPLTIVKEEVISTNTNPLNLE